MPGLVSPEPDAEPRPPVPSISDQPNEILRRAYEVFRASDAPRFLLHLFLPYPDNEYRVVVDADGALPDPDTGTALGHLLVEAGDDFPPAAAVIVEYPFGTSCIVAAYPDGTLTVDYRTSDMVPAREDSDNIIEPEQWSHPGLLGDALEATDFALDPALRGQPETPIRYYPGCEPDLTA